MTILQMRYFLTVCHCKTSHMQLPNFTWHNQR